MSGTHFSGSSIDTALFAQLAQNETVTGDWTFDTKITVPIIENATGVIIRPSVADVGVKFGGNNDEITVRGVGKITHSGIRMKLDSGAGEPVEFTEDGIIQPDTDASHAVTLIWAGSNVTADRTITIFGGDASRSLTLGGNFTIDGTTTISAFGATLVDDVDASSARTTLGALGTADIDTLAELNAIITDATLINTTDARLSDARTPLAHTHAASDITAGTFAAGTFDFVGSTITDLGTVSTANIDGGTIDGTTIGGASPAAATVSSLTNNGVTTVGVGTKNDGKVTSDSVEVQTTDATVTTIATIPLLDENLYQIGAEINGDESDGTDRITAEIKGSFFRTAAGSATQQGSTDLIHRERTIGTWNVTFAVSGNNVLVQVKGSGTVEWAGNTTHNNVSET